MAEKSESPRLFVFSARPGGRYLAGRTLRALRALNLSAENVCDVQALELARILSELSVPIWFIRAGAWPLSTKISFPPSSHTGRPLCALGLLRADNAEASQWSQLLAQSGGDFSALKTLSESLPPPLSAYLEAPLVTEFARNLAMRGDFAAALNDTIGSAHARVVHFPALDVGDDSCLRVAQLITSLQLGGAERVALDLSAELPSRGVRPLLITLGGPTRAAFPAPNGTIDVSRSGSRTDRISAAIVAAQTFHADLIHGHLLNGDDVVGIRDSGVPLVLTVHNARAGWQQGLENIRVGDAKLLVACSRAVESDLRVAKLSIPVRTAWNGIDFAPYERTPEFLASGIRLRESLELNSTDFVLLALANPRPQKRLELLPAILAATQSEFAARKITRRVRLVIAGEASRASDEAARCEQALRDEIARLKLDADVRLVGAQTDVVPLLAAADVLVSMSAYEGLSLAHLEALAAGIPVVATGAGGTAEIAKDNPAFSVVPLDAKPPQVAAILCDIAKSFPPLSVKRGEGSGEWGGRTAASVHFSRQRMAEQYARLYPRALAGGGDTPVPEKTGGLFLIANNFSTGGAQSSARRLLFGLAAQGVSVEAAVLQEQNEFPTPGRRALMAAGIPVHALPPAGTLDPAEAVAQLLEKIDAAAPRAVLFWNVITEYKVLLADALLDTPIFDISPGEMYFSSLEKYFSRPRPGMPYRSASEYGQRLAGAIVKYQAEVAQGQDLLQTAVHVIPNGVPLDEAPRKHSVRELLVIGTAARISPQKKLEELIDALRLAAPKLPPHVLCIAGGEERGSEGYLAQLKQRTTGLCVEWLGELEDTRSFLRELDIFAMISEPAGCPNASLEAMAAGLPVIATDVGGAREQIDDGVSGRIVPRGDINAFAEAIVELSRDISKRQQWGAAAYERAGRLFNMARMVSDYRRVCLGSAISS